MYMYMYCMINICNTICAYVYMCVCMFVYFENGFFAIIFKSPCVVEMGARCMFCYLTILFFVIVLSYHVFHFWLVFN